MTTSLLLATDTWDLILDANGNVALADAPYSMAQDVACAIRLMKGELWYDTTQGVPYFENILGKYPSLQYIKSQVEKAALTVPTVAKATCTLVSFKNRILTGNVLVYDAQGVANNVTF